MRRKKPFYSGLLNFKGAWDSKNQVPPLFCNLGHEQQAPPIDPLDRPCIKRLMGEIGELDYAISQVREIERLKEMAARKLVKPVVVLEGEPITALPAAESQGAVVLRGDKYTPKTTPEVGPRPLLSKAGMSGIRKEIEMTSIHVDPHKVVFTNPCINDRFSCGRSVESTIEALKSGEITPEEIPPITVVQQGDRFLSLDHRRLYAFKGSLPQGTKVLARLVTSQWLVNQFKGRKVYQCVKVERERTFVRRPVTI